MPGNKTSQKKNQNTQSLSPRIPPHNYEAEESVLGSLLIDKEAVLKVADMLTADDFYKPTHRHTYQAAIDLHEKGDPIDVVSLVNRLKEKKILTEIGGEVAVTRLATAVPTAGNVAHYGNIVQKAATLRRLISAAANITDMGFEESEEVDTVLDEAEQLLFSVSREHKQQHFTKISDALEDAFERIDRLNKGSQGLRGVSTGFKDIDNKLAGWQKSDLIILAARPSVGKTTLALDFARHAALAGTTVGLFSLEMSKEQLVDRLLAAHAHVDLWRMRSGKLEVEGEYDDFSRLGQAMGELSEAPLFIDDHASNNVMGMRTMARRLQSEHDLGLLVIDYLQLMESNKYKDNRVQEVSDISRGLKKLAIELDIPIIALSQLNRGIEMRTDQRPKLSDLRESGCLVGTTLITRADTGERVTIKSLADRDKQETIPVFALNDDYQIVVKPMVKVFYSGRKMVYRLKMRSGREIKASANHPFRSLEGWTSLEDLSAGDKIAVPRQLITVGSVDSLVDDELVLLAHLIGDGTIVPNQPIHYTSADMDNIEAVELAARRLFNIEPRRVMQENWWHVYLPSPYRLARGKRNPISHWLADMGLELCRAWQKFVPEPVFMGDHRKIALFLHHLWATDGNISWKLLAGRKPSAAIYYGSSSPRLARDVQQLLLRVGIISTLRVSPSKKYRDMHQVHIQGKEMQLKFLEDIGCYGERGLIVPELVSRLNQIKTNVNTDIIPKEAWQGVITKEKEQTGASWRDLQAGIGISYCGSTIYKSGLSRYRMHKVAVALKSKSLEKLAASGIFWDEVLKIKKEGEEDVFDATVPGVHNFVADDIVVHNSIEQDSDVVMFIHRDPDQFEDGVERPDIYDVSLMIEKHRNGPTGEIPLRFNTKYVTMTPVDQQHNEGMPVEISEAEMAVNG